MSNDPVQNPYTPSSTTDSSASTVDRPQTIRKIARIHQTISLALVAGIIFITATLLFLVVTKANRILDLLVINVDSVILLGIGFGVSIICGIACVVMRRLTQQAAVREFLANHSDVSLPIPLDEPFPGSEKLLAGFATANMIGAALLEGPAVINAILMFAGENLWHLIPIALAVIGILLTMPTITKVQHFVEDVVGRSR